MTELFSVRKLAAALLILGCFVVPGQPCASAQDAAGSADEALLDEISQAAFLFFVNEADPNSGLARDKTEVEYCSIASVGFGLAALPIAAERGWIDPRNAEIRALRALRTLARSSAHHHGIFCHYIWAITACGGPGNRYVVPGHQPRGAKGDKPEGGTLAPYGAAMALPFLRDDAMAAMRHMRRLEISGRPIWRDREQGGYGLPDSFNIDEDYISDRTFGIAHGPMLLMIEDARTGLIWKLFMSNKHIRAGIQRAGFRRDP